MLSFPVPLEETLFSSLTGFLPIHFLGIGAQKAGTSWLFANLRHHPSLFLPEGKELHFFDKGHLSQGLEPYLANFAPGEGKICGEITPAYSLLDEASIRLLHEHAPHLKLIFAMRNPLERAWSAAKMELAALSRKPAKEITEEEYYEHLIRPITVAKGDYEIILRKWRTVYPEQQLFLMFMKEIRNEPEALLNRLFDFLGAPRVTDFSPFPVRKKVVPNPAGLNPHQRGTNLAIPPRALPILREIFEPKIKRLSFYLKTDLSHWLKPIQQKAP